MEGLSGHLSSREVFTHHGGPTTVGGGGGGGGQGGTGYSSPRSYPIDVEYNSSKNHNKNQQQQQQQQQQHHHHQQQPSLIRGGSHGRHGNGGGHIGMSQHVQHHPSIVIENNNISRPQHDNGQQNHPSSILPRQDAHPAIGDVGVPGNPARLGMSVQDLKNMTAMRMAQQQQQNPGAGSPGGGQPNQSQQSSSTPTGLAHQLQRHNSSGLVSPHGQSQQQQQQQQQQHDNNSGGLVTGRSQQGNPQLLRHQQREQRELKDSQVTMASPTLSRHSSAQSMSSFPQQSSAQQATPGGVGRLPQLAIGQTRGQEPGVLIMGEQHHPQRAIHRGASAPRLYSSPPLEDAGPNANGRLFAHGLSVEELKEMTKLRLQHQQGGSGRSSPKTGISRPNSAIGGDSRGGGGGGASLGHDRVEWRQPAVGDELHRGGLMVRDEMLPGSAGMVRRAKSLVQIVPHGSISREGVATSAVGGRRVFGSVGSAGGVGVGRMDVSMFLEDRMRAMQSETQATSPRILSQPSSPCFSQPGSPTSSAGGTSPRRGNRHGGGYMGSVGGPPPGFAGNSGSRGGGGGGGGGGDDIFVHRVVGSSGFSSSTSLQGGGDRGGMNLNVVRPIRSASVGGLGGMLRPGTASPHMAGGSGPAGRGSPAIMVDGLDGSGFGVSAGGGGMMSERSVRARSFDGRDISSFASLVSGSSLAVGGTGNLSGDGGGGHAQHVNASMAPGSHLSLNRARRSSYDERMMTGHKSVSPPPHQNQLQHQHGVWGTDHGHHDGPGRQQDNHREQQGLQVVVGDKVDRLRSMDTSAPSLHNQRPVSLGRSTAVGFERMTMPPSQSLAPGASGGRSGGSSSVDAIASQCAEFALLTPKSSAIAARQSGIGGSSAGKMWSPQRGGSGDAIGSKRMTSSNTNAPSNRDPVLVRGGSVGSYTESGLAVEIQASSRGGSPAGSPEQHGDGDENGESSCGSGSGGGSRQGSVHAAFGAIDAAVGRGGGGEAAGSFDGSFPLGSDGSAGRNGGGEVEAQRFGRPAANGAFFGEDLPDCAGMSLEDEVANSERSTPPSHPRHDSPASLSALSNSSPVIAGHIRNQQQQQQRNKSNATPPGFQAGNAGSRGDYGSIGPAPYNHRVNTNGVIGRSGKSSPAGQSDQSGGSFEFSRAGEGRSGNSRGGSPGSRSVGSNVSAMASPSLPPPFISHR